MDDARRNWAGNIIYAARTVHEPRNLAELQDIVRRSPKLRVLGSRHSFNSIADTDGEQVSLAKLERVGPHRQDRAHRDRRWRHHLWPAQPAPRGRRLRAAQSRLAAAHLGRGRGHHGHPRLRRHQHEPRLRCRRPHHRHRQRRAADAQARRSGFRWRGGRPRRPRHRQRDHARHPAELRRPPEPLHGPSGPRPARQFRVHRRRGLQRQPLHAMGGRLHPAGLAQAAGRCPACARDLPRRVRRHARLASDLNHRSRVRRPSRWASPARGTNACRISASTSHPASAPELQSEYFVARQDGVAAIKRCAPSSI